jgi:RimJ/RimL family protein N-acetyltransferase
VNLQNLVNGTFKILNGMPYYLTIEEKEEINYNHDKWQSKLRSLLLFAEKLNLNRLGVQINNSTVHYLPFTNMLLELGFEKFASRVEVFRSLEDIEIRKSNEWRSIADGTISEDEFKQLWEQCMSGSDNAASTLTIEDHFQSVKSELGEEWRKSCLVIYEGNKPIGITIPHIEPGTKREGRLFYFGILPEERGKGKSTRYHYQSLGALKQMGATYYIGGTHEANKRMQKVFQRNGCSIQGRTESYYKYFTKS